MHCPRCGVETEPNGNFCISCGHKLQLNEIHSGDNLDCSRPLSYDQFLSIRAEKSLERSSHFSKKNKKERVKVIKDVKVCFCTFLYRVSCTVDIRM